MLAARRWAFDCTLDWTPYRLLLSIDTLVARDRIEPMSVRTKLHKVPQCLLLRLQMKSANLTY